MNENTNQAKTIKDGKSQITLNQLMVLCDGDLNKLKNDFVALCFAAMRHGVPTEYIAPMWVIWEGVFELD